MKKLLAASLALLLCIGMMGCISAEYQVTPEKTEFRFVMLNESDIGDLEIKAPGGWHVKASRVANRTEIDQGLIGDAVIRALPAVMP